MNDHEMVAAVRQAVRDEIRQMFGTDDGVEIREVYRFSLRQMQGSQEMSKYMKRGFIGLVFAAIPGVLWLAWQGLISKGGPP